MGGLLILLLRFARRGSSGTSAHCDRSFPQIGKVREKWWLGRSGPRRFSADRSGDDPNSLAGLGGGVASIGGNRGASPGRGRSGGVLPGYGTFGDGRRGRLGFARGGKGGGRGGRLDSRRRSGHRLCFFAACLGGKRIRGRRERDAQSVFGVVVGDSGFRRVSMARDALFASESTPRDSALPESERVRKSQKSFGAGDRQWVHPSLHTRATWRSARTPCGVTRRRGMRVCCTSRIADCACSLRVGAKNGGKPRRRTEESQPTSERKA